MVPSAGHSQWSSQRHKKLTEKEEEIPRRVATERSQRERKEGQGFRARGETASRTKIHSPIPRGLVSSMETGVRTGRRYREEEEAMRTHEGGRSFPDRQAINYRGGGKDSPIGKLYRVLSASARALRWSSTSN